MSDTWDGNPATGDAARKMEIEYLMVTDRPRYFRDEAMQQEYRDILDRQAGRQPSALATAQPKMPSLDWDPAKKQTGLPNWTEDYFVRTPEAQRPASLLDGAINGNEHERAIDRLPVAKVITWAAADAGLDPRTMRIIANLESSGKPGPDPKKKYEAYKGLFQLSDKLFEKHGRSGGNVYDAKDNAEAAMRSIAANIKEFKRLNNGREPTQPEIYMSHQQGVGGITAHLQNLEQPAWQTMRNTLDGRRRAASPTPYRGLTGPEAADLWAQNSIWDNLTKEEKKKFPDGVDTVTSGQFLDFWKRRFEGRR